MIVANCNHKMEQWCWRHERKQAWRPCLHLAIAALLEPQSISDAEGAEFIMNQTRVLVQTPGKGTLPAWQSG